MEEKNVKEERSVNKITKEIITKKQRNEIIKYLFHEVSTRIGIAPITKEDI